MQTHYSALAPHPNIPILPTLVPEVLLRTRPIPEIESENEKLLALGSSVIEGDERSASVIENPGCSEDKEARILDIWEVHRAHLPWRSRLKCLRLDSLDKHESL